MTVWTLGLWRVKQGREDDFVAAWRAMADATKADQPDASAVLLRDRDNPGLFISTGPWDSPDQVAAWRSSAAFVEGVARIKDCLESFEPHTMDQVVEVPRD